MEAIKKRLIILGAGGHGRAVAEAALLSERWGRIAFLDDDFPKITETLGFEVLGRVADLTSVLSEEDQCIIAIGNQEVRQRLFESLTSKGVHHASVFHPRAWISPAAQIGLGVAVMAGAVVGCQAYLGQGVIVNANSTVDHDVVLEDFVHIGVGVQLAGGVVVRKRAWLQAGCAAGYRVVVPEDSIIAPGIALSDG